MESLSVRISVVALAILVIVGFAACMNPVAGSTGGAKSGGLSVASRDAMNSHTLMPATSSKRGRGRIVCAESIQIDLSAADPYWKGTLKGCALNGATVEFREKPTNYTVGNTEHFFENMRITKGKRNTMTGDDAGIWNLSTFKYRANGRVTGATGSFAYLVGYKVHEVGYTTVNPPPAGTTKLYGTGTLWLAPR